MDRLRRARRDGSGSEITGRVGQRRGFVQRPHGERFRAELFAPKHRVWCTRLRSGRSALLPEANRHRRRAYEVHIYSHVMARNDDGGWMPEYSRLAADYATPFLAQTWRQEKFGIGRGFRRGSVAVGIGFGSNLWQEFWPDLKKKVWRGSKRFPARAQRWKPSWL